ncbi:HNH endonuclease [Patescibacteria group bacterium]|nr:HNH endonuclease [Patescibacteria group bacterium]
MSNQRPKISDPIRRKIRQRCGFGCVLCGYPLYEYDHIEGWANVKRHQEEDITLLCVTHHTEVTHKLLSREAVKAANKDPYNHRQGVSKPYFLNYAGGDLETEIGGNIFQAAVPLIIEDQPIIGYQSDGENLLLYVKLFDKDGNLVLDIDANELVYSIDRWDIELVANQLTIRADKGKFLVRMRFIVPHKLYIDRGIIQYKNRSVFIQDQQMTVDNAAILSGSRITAPVGIAIGTYTRPFSCAIRIN